MCFLELMKADKEKLLRDYKTSLAVALNAAKQDQDVLNEDTQRSKSKRRRAGIDYKHLLDWNVEQTWSYLQFRAVIQATRRP